MSGAIAVLTPEEAKQLPGPRVDLPSAGPAPAEESAVEITRARAAEPAPEPAPAPVAAPEPAPTPPMARPAMDSWSPGDDVADRYETRWAQRRGILPAYTPPEPIAEVSATPDAAGYDAIKAPDPRRGTLRLPADGGPQTRMDGPLPTPQMQGPPEPDRGGVPGALNIVANTFFAAQQGVVQSVLEEAEPVKDAELQRRLQRAWNDDGPSAERLRAARERAQELGVEVVFRASEKGGVEAVQFIEGMKPPGGEAGRLADAFGRVLGLAFVDPMAGAAVMAQRGPSGSAMRAVASSGGVGPAAERVAPAMAGASREGRAFVVDQAPMTRDQIVEAIEGITGNRISGDVNFPQYNLAEVQRQTPDGRNPPPGPTPPEQLRVAILDPQNAGILSHELGHVGHMVAVGDVPPMPPAAREALDRFPDAKEYLRGAFGDRAKQEAFAEAVRLYIGDPSSFKAEAPEAAAWVRETLDGSPAIRDWVQFRVLPLLLAGGAASLGNEE